MIINLVESVPLLGKEDHKIRFLGNKQNIIFCFERTIIVNMVEMVALLGIKGHEISFLGSNQNFILFWTFYNCKLCRNCSIARQKKS